MDDGHGHLVPIADDVARQILSSAAASIFKVGEILEIKQSEFKVVSLGKKYMKLKLLPHGFGEEHAERNGGRD